MTSIAIIIPTHGRAQLLERTLRSLAEAELSPEVRQVMVAENGQKGGAETIVEKMEKALPLVYRHTSVANKSHALNEAIEETDADFLLFFDDDVRFHPGTITSYVEGLRLSKQRSSFFCGPVQIDYQAVPPPGWLRPYLPPSVIGWDLGKEACDFTVPDALGANWGAYRADIQAVGGFSTAHGPGTAARGQESDMMMRLLKEGFSGRYLPGALIWHYVPDERCSEVWALRRARQMARGCVASGVENSIAEGMWENRIRICLLSILLSGLGHWLTPARRFHYRYRLESRLGLIEGRRRSSLIH